MKPPKYHFDDLSAYNQQRLALALPPGPEDQCWEWSDWCDAGYGRISIQTAPNKSEKVLVHRMSYEMRVGRIPDGKVLDHLCFNTKCYSPFHLRPLTAVENVMLGRGLAAINKLKTHCNKGHDLSDPAVLYVPPKKPNTRDCRICRHDAAKRHVQRKAQAA